MVDETRATSEEFRAITGVDNKMPDALGVAVTPEIVQKHRQSLLDRARGVLGIGPKPKVEEQPGPTQFGVAIDATPKRINPDDVREAIEDRAEAEARREEVRNSIRS